MPTATYDAVVVGASFAGLSFAQAGAAHGMRVLVLERDATVGGVVRTTGVLFSDVLSLMDVPPRFLLNAVNAIELLVPGRAEPLRVGATAPRFFMADVTGMLRWMAEGAADHGAAVWTGAIFQGATRDADGLLTVAFTAGGERITARAGYVVGADGAHSSVARSFGLDQNTAFLAGAEWLAEGVALDRQTFHLIMDQTLAPGYCLWLAPHGDLVALGVAGHQRAFKPAESLQMAQTLFGRRFDLSRMRIVERKGGVIPIGGRLRRVHRDDERGRALLLGDAAGYCGAATGGGIYPALLAGRLAAHAVANERLNGVAGAVKRYLRDLPHAGRLGPYLRVEDWLRRGMNRLHTNSDLAAFYGLFATPQGERVLRRALFETPILSMDGSFFGMISGLLGQSPALTSSLWQAARARVGIIFPRLAQRAGEPAATGSRLAE